MKIVIEAWSARVGGGQTYLRNLLASFPEGKGLDVHVYAPASLELPLHPGITRRTTRWPVTNPLLRVFWQLFVLPLILWREKADVLFCPGGLVLTPAPPGCQVVTMFRNMLPFDAELARASAQGVRGAKLQLLRWLMLRSMRRADMTIFISTYCRQLIERLIPLRQAVTIYHGIAEHFRTGNATPAPATLTAGRYLLYVSRFDIYKHHLELVEAFARLPEAMRSEYPLVLVGEDDSVSAARVRARIAELGVEAQVIIAGAVPYAQLPGWYAHAALNLFLSSCENCPNILLEAMAAGRPIVCSSVAPMPEFAGDAAMLVDPRVPAQIADAIQAVLADDGLAQQLADRAAQRSRDFSWATSAAQTWEVLAGMACSRS